MEIKSSGWLAGQLERPKKPVDVVLDTDTYNEIDDQFALAYLIGSSDRLNLQGIYGAPFFNQKSLSPRDGMEKSYEEIMNILSLMKREDLKPLVCKGSDRYLPSENEAVDSPAARDLIQKAMAHTPENPLYVIGLAVITTIASAILLKPEITDRIVVVWLGGNAYYWPNNLEFNMTQDIAAARVVFGSGVPLVQVPCMGVASTFRVSGPELKYYLKGKNPLCDYLAEVTQTLALQDGGNTTWSRPIWDVTAVAWLTGDNFEKDHLVSSPIPEYDHRYAFDPTRHLIKCVYEIHRDLLLEDLVKKLTKV